jgi:hypothetical protein
MAFVALSMGISTEACAIQDGAVQTNEMSQAKRIYLGAVEKITDEADPDGALHVLRRSFERGYETPSDILREPAFAAIRRDPAKRKELRALLAANCRESKVAMVAQDEAGKRLQLQIEVVDRESGKPLAGTRMFLYHTDDQGDYAPEATEAGGGSDNPRLFAYVRTDAQGRAEVQSIMPGSYRGTRIVRHIHLVIDRDATAAFGTGIYFDTDPAPDEEIRTEAAQGRVCIAELEKVGDVHKANAQIRVPRS